MTCPPRVILSPLLKIPALNQIKHYSIVSLYLPVMSRNFRTCPFKPIEIFIHKTIAFSDKFYMTKKTKNSLKEVCLYCLAKALALFFFPFSVQADVNKPFSKALFQNKKSHLFSETKPAWRRSLKKPFEKALFSQNEKVDTFDPFIDYNEFQDNESEKESIIFLKNGRLLTIAVFGGYEALTYTMRDLYGDTLGTFGAYINFFFDLQFALQLHIVFPRTHHFTILQSRPVFSSYGIDFKYYFNKQNLVKGIAVLNPYIVFGPFLMKVSKFHHNVAIQAAFNTPPQAPSPLQDPESQEESSLPTPAQDPPLTPLERLNIKDSSRVGARVGLGVEIPVFKQTFIGFEISYSYVQLPFQNEDLSRLDTLYTSVNPTFSTQQITVKRNFLQRALVPDRPTDIPSRTFIGDLVNGVIILGINF